MKTWPPEWTPDCQGKWDYDAAMLYVSTRYWPRGGGVSIFDGQDFQTNANRDIRPAAHSAFYLAETVIAEKEFEGETEAEVKRDVESWVAEQYARLIDGLRGASPSGRPPTPDPQGETQ